MYAESIIVTNETTTLQSVDIHVYHCSISNCLVASTSETTLTTSKSGLQAFQVIHIQEVDDKTLYSITGLAIRWYLPYFTYGCIMCRLGVQFLNHYNTLCFTW